MIISSAQIKLYAPWVNSLKEKRMIVKSLCAKVHNKFNASVAETDEQDMHRIIVLGIACVTNDSRLGDSIIDSIVNFIEANTEAEITGIERHMA